ncbi:amino acid adenylation domain-containing protein [Pseudomonas sp. P39-UII1]|uniref:non-ribosomal peptide synthetase n=1 Tax=Pseudomonas sp. P39-UII1 TaxID=3080333 RepID=UPI00320B5434
MSTMMVESVALCPQQHWALQALKRATTFAEATRRVTLDIQGELDVPRLQRAVAALPELHPELTARLQAVTGFHGLRWCPVADCTSLPLTSHLALVSGSQAQLQREAWLGQAFSLAGGPWAQALLLRLGQTHWQLTLAVASVLVDGPGMGLLAEGLITLYGAPETRLSEEAGCFEQYLEWRAETAIDEDAEQAQRYWRDHLQGESSGRARLPYRLGDSQGSAMERVHAEVAPVLLAGLQAQAAALQVAPLTVVQAAWWVLLGRVSEQPGFLAQWRHDSREDYDYFAHSAGVLEKSLPLKLRIDDAQPFDEWVAQLATLAAQHVTWQEYWAAAPDEAPPALGFAAAREHCASAPQGWRLEQAPRGGEPCELMLQVQLSAEGDCKALWLDFLPDCYDASSVQRLLEQLLMLLQGIVDDATQAVGAFNLVDQAEQARLLALNPALPASPAPLLMARLAQWLAHDCTRDVVVHGDQRLSYGTLGQRVQRLAASLAAQGVGPGARVAVALPRSSALVESILATWWLGAAYVPLDPQWPQARQANIVSRAGAAWVVGQAAQSAPWQMQGVQLLDPAMLVEQPLGQCTQPYPLQGDEAAYILFTSGSTGEPKGVIIEHRQLANYLAGATQVMGLAQCSQFAFTSGVAADLGNTTLFGALYNGACLQVADEETLRDPERFMGYLRGGNVDCLKIVPSHLSALLEAEHPCLPATLVLGGEAPAPSLLERIFQVRADCRVFNHYGPTEATVGVMVQALSPASAGCGPVGLGSVLPGNQVYVLDGQQRLVPPGVLGELYISGRQLCRGYLNSATDVFVDNPFAAGERLYRTGDLARYRVDGSLALHGRKDQQVKLNGFRVELGELEAELLQVPCVREAAVVAVPAEDAQAGLQPAAFVVVHADEQDPLASIRRDLALQLPGPLLPRRIQVVAQLPRLANGKVDRQALASLAPQPPEAELQPARTAFEQLLAKRMGQLLDQPALGLHQDFFAAGGHSLLAIKLVAGIRKVLRRDISPAMVFDNPTVAQLAQALGELPDADPQALEALARAHLQLEALPPEQRAALEEKARRLREAQS